MDILKYYKTYNGLTKKPADFHLYKVQVTDEWIVWYVDNSEIDRFSWNATIQLNLPRPRKFRVSITTELKSSSSVVTGNQDTDNGVENCDTVDMEVQYVRISRQLMDEGIDFILSDFWVN